MALLVDVVSKEDFANLANNIEEALLKALHFLGKDNCSVEVCLLDDKEMALVNKKSRGKEGPTTVLSFEEPEEIPRIQGEPYRLGEIYLAPRTIKRKEMDSVRVAIHGLLHLLGYTHKRRSDTMEMERVEDKIWQTLSQD
jgi:probable rRNA maturation factor